MYFYGADSKRFWLQSFKKCDSLIISAIGKQLETGCLKSFQFENSELLDSIPFQNSVALAEPEAGGVVNLSCTLY